ncbi:MAG: tetratricopeptide repeat protein [Parachlamydiaceae bacterium]
MRVRFINQTPEHFTFISGMKKSINKGGHFYYLVGKSEIKYSYIQRVGLAVLAFIKTTPLGVGLFFKSTKEDWKTVFTGKKIVVYYQKGKQYQRSDEELRNLENLANKGDARAQRKMGQTASNRGDFDQAERWFLQAADLGDMKAQLFIGKMYSDGWGVKEDGTLASYYMQKAVISLKRAGDSGDWAANWKLGSIYADDKHVPKDRKAAFKCFREASRLMEKAARLGDAKAQLHLGEMYLSGKGVEQNYALALKYFHKSAKGGYAFAQVLLGDLYFQPSNFDIERDPVKGFKYYQLAANQGYHSATRRIAECYRYGRGVEQDEQQAIKYDQLAAAQGGLGAHEGAWL